jgi:hypothetical protein
VQKMSRRVNLNVSNVKGNFSATVEANVLDDITGTTTAIEWSDRPKRKLATPSESSV